MFTYDTSFNSEAWATDCMEFSQRLEHLRIQLPLGIYNIAEVHKAMEENLELLLQTKALTLLMPRGDDWVGLQEKVIGFCGYLCVSLPQLESLNLGLLSPGWHFEAERACFPVRALEAFVDQIPHLKAMSLEKIKFCADQNNAVEAEDDISNVIARALKDHPSLEKFEWRGCCFDPVSMDGFDPILTSLASISTLQVMIVKVSDKDNLNDDTISSKLDDIATGCPRLRVLKLEGIYVNDFTQKTALKQCRKLEQLELNLKLEESALRVVPAMGQAFAKLLKPESSTLESLWIKLHFKQPPVPRFPHVPQPQNVVLQVGNGQSRKKRKLRATQKFHDEISSSLCNNTKLKVLGILFHDDTTNADEENGTLLPVLNAKSFHKCVANNRTLKNLCIPLCGHDEVIRFYLMVNRTEMFYRFSLEPSCRALLEDFLQVLVEQWCHQTSELHHLSLVYYYLRQMPILIPSSSRPE
ncbi:unknown protein [Seminavis robusta]|uniref:Uncharacterized protein n=1 Tax=Seminavis robusta TaxID=568900 RepID=A0A9N8EDC8_9STRA|nr:unknown protein [Seminavis robusta]|eukprot:Sro779_g201240.1 n/a (469) ;mRNA; f:12609-14015